MYLQEVSVILLISVLSLSTALPQQQKSKRPVPVFKKQSEGLRLPANATMIRENIVDTFSCDEKIYGYYADVDNDCQIFHVCMPQERSGNSTPTSLKWSFICPAETVFNQATFVCTRTESSIPCEESENYYSLNEEFGKVEEEENENETPEIAIDEADADKVSQATTARTFRRGRSRNGGETTVEIQEPEVARTTVASSRNARISGRFRA